MQLQGTLKQILAATIFGVGALGAMASSDTALAHYAVCRSDPAVFLSNNTKIQLSAQVTDDQSDIHSIPWTLYIPHNVSVTKVVYTQGPIGQLETLQVYSTNAPHYYDAYTAMAAGTNNIGVTSTMQYVEQNADYNLTTQAAGGTNQQLHTQVIH